MKIDKENQPLEKWGAVKKMLESKGFEKITTRVLGKIKR